MGKHSVSPEDWYKHDHQSIYDTAQGFDSGKVTAASQALSTIADRLHAIVDTAGLKVQGILVADWRGQAAEAAQEGFSGLFKRANTSVQTTREIANALPALGHAMDAAKAAIEPPVSEATALATAGTNSTLLSAANMARVGEQQHARYQMTSLFSQPAVDTSNRVDDVPNPTQVMGRFQNTTNNNTSNSIDTGSKSLGQVQDQINNLDKIGNTKPAFDQGAQGPGQPAGSAGGGQSAGQGTGGSGSGSAPGGLPAGQGGLPGATRPTAKGLDDGYFSRPNSILQDPLGRNNDKWVPVPKSPLGQDRIDGVPGGRPAGMPGASSAGYGAGRGAGSMGMMPVNARGSGRGDGKDSGHKIPETLFNQDNTDELIGQLRNGAPPVIGELTPEEIKYQKQQQQQQKELVQQEAQRAAYEQRRRMGGR